MHLIIDETLMMLFDDFEVFLSFLNTTAICLHWLKYTTVNYSQLFAIPFLVKTYKIDRIKQNSDYLKEFEEQNL